MPLLLSEMAHMHCLVPTCKVASFTELQKTQKFFCMGHRKELHIRSYNAAAGMCNAPVKIAVLDPGCHIILHRTGPHARINTPG